MAQSQPEIVDEDVVEGVEIAIYSDPTVGIITLIGLDGLVPVIDLDNAEKLMKLGRVLLARSGIRWSGSLDFSNSIIMELLDERLKGAQRDGQQQDASKQ